MVELQTKKRRETPASMRNRREAGEWLSLEPPERANCDIRLLDPRAMKEKSSFSLKKEASHCYALLWQSCRKLTR